MLTLSSMPGACSLADHIALVWSGLPYKVNIVSYQDTKSPEYLAKNPQGMVPVLENGDWVLTQNLAILTYITEKAPEANIGAKDNTPESKAKLASWLAYITSDYHKALGNLFMADAFGLSDEAKSQLKAATIQMAKDKHLSKMDQYLAQHQFLMDNRKTVADAYFWVVTSWIYGFIPTLATEFPNLHAYFERLKQDPDIQRALEEQKTTA